MRVIRYEIAADEAWTHQSPPLNRYWTFFGGVFGPEASCDRLENSLKSVLDAEGHRGEVKWSSVTGFNLDLYKSLVDVFFENLENEPLLTYRQMFLDRQYVRVPPPGEQPASALDAQFKLCYQFIKHHFGLKHLPSRDPHAEHHLIVRLDNHSSQHHKDDLAKFLRDLGSTLGCPRLKVSPKFVNSKHFRRLQICDLLMGAAGSYGNKMHLLRTAKKRGMTDKQKWRLDMARHIYNHFRRLDAITRGSRAFNWFESTGGDSMSSLSHKLSIWKFKPQCYRIDEGWQNDSLDKQGRYVAEKINPMIHCVGSNGTSSEQI